MRWVLLIQEYDLEVIHKPGKDNLDADALSRHPKVDSLLAIDQINEDSLINSEQNNDPDIQTTIELIAKKSNDLHLRNFVVKNGLLYYQDNKTTRVVVPTSLRSSLIQRAHASPTSGHMGYNKVLKKLKTKFYWPNMAKDISKFVRSCDVCQRIKVYPSTEIPPQPMDIPMAPFFKVAWDIVGPFQTSFDGHTHILVIVDHLTRWVEAYPLKDVSGNSIAEKFIREFIPVHGVPKELLSDQGANLIKGVVQHMCEFLSVKQIKTSPYHPNSNGAVERINGVITASLSSYVNHEHNDWHLFLPFILLSIRSAPRQSLDDISPFVAVFGRDPVLPEDVWIGYQPSSDYVNDTAFKIALAQELVYNSLHALQESKDPNFLISYAVNDLVLVRAPYRIAGIHAYKFFHRYIGPYRIVKKKSDVTYLIKPVAGGPVSSSHVSRLRKYFQAPSFQPIPTIFPDHLEQGIALDPSTEDPTPSVTASPGEEESKDFEVEQILDKKILEDILHYKVKFKGYPNSFNEWLPISHLSCPLLIKKFEDQLSSKRVSRRK